MKRLSLVFLLSLIPLYGGMREMAYSELRNTGTYIKSVAPKVRESGSPRAKRLLEKSIERITQAKTLFQKRNYQLCIIYSREARELASFAVKVAIGRVKTKHGILLCKNTLAYLNSRDDIKQHYLMNLKNAQVALEKAYSFYVKEEYKPAMLAIKNCMATMKSITSLMVTNSSDEGIKEKLHRLKEQVKHSKDKNTLILYQRALEEYRKGNYKLSNLLIEAAVRSIKNAENKENNILEVMEKEIVIQIKAKKLSEKQRKEINKLLTEYYKTKKRGDYLKAKILLENIKQIISGN